MDRSRVSPDRARGGRGRRSAGLTRGERPCSVETLEARQLLAATVGVPEAWVLGPSPSLAAPAPPTPALASSPPPSSGFSIAPLPLVVPGASCDATSPRAGDSLSPPPAGGSAAFAGAGPDVGSGGGSADDGDDGLVFAYTDSDGQEPGAGDDQPPAEDIPPPNSEGVLDAKALRRGLKIEEEFREAKTAFTKLPEPVKQMMNKINNGTRSLQDFLDLPVDYRQAILDYYRATAARAYRSNAEAVQQLNQHRIDYLTGKRSDPPGPISNFPKPKVQ